MSNDLDTQPLYIIQITRIILLFATDEKNLAQGAAFQRPFSSPTPVPRPKKETDLRFVDVKAKFRLPVFTFYFSEY